jgi:hypothetical protein
MRLRRLNGNPLDGVHQSQQLNMRGMIAGDYSSVVFGVP